MEEDEEGAPGGGAEAKVCVFPFFISGSRDRWERQGREM